MMQLRFLRNENCLECGAPTVMTACRRFHCNGQGFEEREFGCGRREAWIPNFSSMEVKSICRQSRKYKSQVDSRQKAFGALLKYIEEDWQTDKEHRRYVLSSVKSYAYQTEY